MKERPILFSDPMVRAILSGQKTQTRRVVKPFQVPKKSDNGGWFATVQQHPRWGFGVGGDTEQECAAKLVEFGGCPYGQPGDRLWVREAFQPMIAEGLDWPDADYKTGKGYTVSYRATDGRQEFVDLNTDDISTRVRPSIHMPRWACRLVLEIVSVRVERLQDISEADARAEGVESPDAERTEHDERICQQCGGTRLYTAHSIDGARPDTDCDQCDTNAKRFRHLWQSINGADSWAANPWVWVIEFKAVQP